MDGLELGSLTQTRPAKVGLFFVILRIKLYAITSNK